MQERLIEKKSCKAAEADGWIHRKLTWLGRHGAPDRFFAKAGRIVLMEFKQLGKKPTPIQENEIARLSEAGIEVYVVDSVELCMSILSRKRRNSDLI